MRAQLLQSEMSIYVSQGWRVRLYSNSCETRWKERDEYINIYSLSLSFAIYKFHSRIYLHRQWGLAHSILLSDSTVHDKWVCVCVCVCVLEFNNPPILNSNTKRIIADNTASPQSKQKECGTSRREAFCGDWNSIEIDIAANFSPIFFSIQPWYFPKGIEKPNCTIFYQRI